MVNCLKDAEQSSRNSTLTNRTDMGKINRIEDPVLSAICDVLMAKVLLGAASAGSERARARGVELYSGVIAFCDAQLFSIQGSRDPLYRRVCSVVALQFALHPSDLCGKSRVWPKPQARAMTYLLLHERGCTLKRCSEIVGIPVHTVNYAIRTLRQAMDINKDLADIRVKAANKLSTHE